MGAVSFSLDLKFIQCLKKELLDPVFVETGTFKGDTVAAILPYFAKILSVEPSTELWQKATDRFKNSPNVAILNGDAPELLKNISLSLATQQVIYWLDTNWCVANHTVGKESQCSLLKELKAISELNESSFILIDDARLFLSVPSLPYDVNQWPDLNEILGALYKLSSRHEVTVINDIIIFYPISARKAVSTYARQYGVDWLQTYQNSTETVKLRAELVQKEAIIQKQLAKIKLYRKIVFVLPLVSLFLKMKQELFLKFGPKLGNLNQYKPRPCRLPNTNFKQDLIKNYPKISIVTPSFMQGEYVERTILSILNQNYPNLEYYIQDGGSSDETLSILKKHESKIAGWDSNPDGGQSNALNLGFAKTTGEIMAWLNADDLFLPGILHLVADYFNNHNDVDVIYGNRLLINENDLEVGRWILPGHDQKILSWVDYIPQETIFWRRKIWDKIGGNIDESFRFAMDWDLLIRFREAGARFAHLPNLFCAFRVHSKQKTSAEINEIGFKEMDLIRLRSLGYIPSRKKTRAAILAFMMKHFIKDKIFGIQKFYKTHMSVSSKIGKY